MTVSDRAQHRSQSLAALTIYFVLAILLLDRGLIQAAFDG